MNDRRVKGFEKEIARIIGTTILTEVKNEKIKTLVTVYKVNLTKDGRYADVVFTVLDYNKKINKEKILEDLIKIKGFFRKKLSEELQIRYVPELRITLDDSIEYAVKMSALIDKVMEEK